MTSVQPRPNTEPERSQGMRYQRLMELGTGGMANVHLCLAVGQSGFKRLVVVKSVREELLGDPAMRQMFLAEARVSARLNHPNVVQVSEVVEAGESVMLVMEYLDGLPFSAACRVAGDALTRPMRLRILCDVLAGLSYAHDLVDYYGQPLGIVHRDVSAQNVFVTFDGRVKLLDFGIAKVTSAPDRTRTGVIKGRIAYMPVEQVTGKAVDRRTDVYAIGCLLWEAVAGSRMWGKLTEPEIVRSIVQGSVPQLSSRVTVDPELEAIVTKATAPSPDDRFASAEELRLELERYLSRLPPVTPRQIGELLSRACAQARADRKRQLAEAVAKAERELSTLGIDAECTSERSRTRPLDGQTAQLSRISTPSNGIVGSLSPLPRLSPMVSEGSKSASVSVSGQGRPRRRGVWLALVVLAVLVVAAWLPSFAAKQSEHSVAKPVATTAALALPLPHTATTPAAAMAATTVEPRDIALEQVEPQPAPSPSGVAAKARRSRPRAATAPAAPGAVVPAARAKSPSCDPPYYFSSGIKTYKPECI